MAQEKSNNTEWRNTEALSQCCVEYWKIGNDSISAEENNYS